MASRIKSNCEKVFRLQKIEISSLGKNCGYSEKRGDTRRSGRGVVDDVVGAAVVGESVSGSGNGVVETNDRLLI